MVGRPLEAFGRRAFGRQNHAADTGAARRPGADDAPPRLRVDGLTRRPVFEGVSFSIHKGEIVGLAGLMGAGRTEVARAIFGVDPLDAGSIEVDGHPVRIRSPHDAVRAGIVMVPEERKSQALVLGMSVGENLTLAHLRILSRGGWLRGKLAEVEAKRQVERVDVRPPRTDVAVNSLSGGNQQKVVIGRWLFNPERVSHRVYLCDEPTRGVDVGARFAIYKILGEIRDTGAALLVISSELLELLSICDRILVMREGRLVNEVLVDDSVTEEQILRSAMAPQVAAA